MKKTFYLVLLALVCILNNANAGRDRGLIYRKTVGAFIEDTKQGLQETMATSIDALMVRAAMIISVQLRNMEIALDDQRQKFIKDLDNQRRQVFDNLIDLLDQLDAGITSLKELEEKLYLDARAIANQLSFILADEVPFLVTSFDGTVISKRDSPYKFKINGIGFDSEAKTGKKEFTALVYINGKQVPIANLDNQTKERALIVKIPHDWITFRDSIYTIPAELRVSWKEKKLLLFSRRRNFPYQFNLLVLPIVAGKVRLKEYYSTTSQVKIGSGFDIVYAISETDGFKPVHKGFDVSNDKKITTAERRREAEARQGGCGFCYNPDGGYTAKYTISNEGRHIELKANCRKPCTLTYWVYWDKYETKTNTESKQHDEQKINYGQEIEIVLDELNDKGEYEVVAELDTGHKIHFKSDETSRKNPIFKEVSKSQVGGRWKVKFIAIYDPSFID